MEMLGNNRDAAPGAPIERDGVAIIGMSCLFPGSPDIDAYWRNILGSVDSITDPPAESWDPALYYDPQAVSTDRVYCKRGGYLGALASFDPLEHGIPPVSVGGEPDQWLALRVARDAMADAGYTELDEAVRRRTAVILGKGTYLNGGSAIAVQHGLIVTQTLEILKRLHPEYTEADLQAVRQGLKDSLPPMGPEIVPGLIPNIIVGRIANRLDLMGPAYTIDAACASSLVAVQLALRDLRSRECDLALVGGSQVWMPVPTLGIFCQLGALSRQQQIRPFDKNADGTLLGEGIGMVVLKRLADAERDGDRVYAVIRGVGVASDGRGLSVMAPRIDGEELALRRAYEDAGVSPQTVELIEAHGTGTPVGDITEVHSLSRVFGPRLGRLPRVAVGSVKSMISHTIPAAGVAAIIKVALALHHKVLPPTLNCEEPNPKLELEKTPFYINTSARPWVHGGTEPRRAGVNAFGFGGINSHVILEEHAPSSAPSTVASDGAPRWPGGSVTEHRIPWDSEVCLFPAESAAQLALAVDLWISRVSALEAQAQAAPKRSLPFELKDVAYTLAQDRKATANSGHCLAVVASSIGDLRAKLEKARERLSSPKTRQIRDVSGIYYASEPLAREGGLAFLIPGEGAQYPNMLADLCLHLPEVRECYDRFDRLFRDMGREFLPSDYIFPRPSLPASEREWTESLLWRIEGAIESVRVANLAIYEVLDRLAVRPDVVVGHSSGEYAALQVTGVLDLRSDEQLARVTRELVQVHQAAFSSGIPEVALIALGTGRDDAEAIARQAGASVYVAMDNCPHQVVLACSHEDAERVFALARRTGVIHEALPFNRPYHTPLFSAYTEKLRGLIDSLTLSPPRTPIYSCTSSSAFPDDAGGVRALLLEHWIRPVEFRRTVERLHDEGMRLFVEAGPRGNLTSFVEDALRGRRFCAIPANVQRRSGVTQLNHLVGILAAHGVGVDPLYFFERRAPRLVDWESLAAPCSGAPARAGLDMILTTGFPPMTLPDSLGADLRRSDRAIGTESVVSVRPFGEADFSVEPLPSENASAAQATGIAGASPLELGPGADDTTNADFASASSALMSAAGASPTPELSSTASDSVAGNSPYGMTGTLRDFLSTMEQFLVTQSGVVRDCLRLGTRSSVSSSTPQPVSVSAPDITAISVETRFPLLGTIVSVAEGQELVAERLFDPAVDAYLADHSLGQSVSDDEPDLRGLIVMPLAMSLEILAEAAVRLAPNMRVTGLRDVRAYRWITFADGPQRLRVSARRLTGDGCRVRVEIRTLSEEARSGDADRGPVVESTVELSERYQEPSPAVSVPADAVPSALRADRLYADVMFHGPMWRGVSSIDQTAAKAATATLRVLSFDGFVRGSTAPVFELDPVTLDAAGQVIGFWTKEQLERGQIVFPFRLDALDLFDQAPPSGESVECRAAIELIGEQQIRSDIDVSLPCGRPWMRLSGWYDRRFELPPQFHPLILPAARTEISTPASGTVRSSPRPEFRDCRRIDAIPGADGGFWKQVWAHAVLGRRERARFAELLTGEQQQLLWLAGRTAAKEAVKRLIARHAGLEVKLADIEIDADSEGHVFADGTWRDELGARPTVSIDDSEGAASATASIAMPEHDASPIREFDLIPNRHRHLERTT
jgi:acyl transferase domain-containing protein